LVSNPRKLNETKRASRQPNTLAAFLCPYLTFIIPRRNAPRITA
jgi:hypothetical protein